MQNKEERIFEPSLFREYLKSKLISLLDSIAGRKMLMLEKAVRTPINLVAQKKIFSEHGVPEEGGITTFEPVIIDKNFDQILIILSPTPQNLKDLRELIQNNLDRGTKKYYPIFWPKRTIACKEYLEQQNLMPYIEIRDFSFDLLPLDIDLYSLEIKSIKDLYINQDHSIYTTVAESIHRIQCVFGKIHNVYYKGRAGRAVYEILKLKQDEIKIDDNYGDIQSLIILDRSVDFVTPLLRQITYEGMMDQFFGISGNYVKVPSSLFEQVKEKKSENAYRNIQLSSQKDYVYEQIRILSINGARSALKTRGAEFDQFVEESKMLKDINEKAAATKRIQAQREYLKKHLTLNSVLMEEMKTISFHKELLLHQRLLMEQEKEIIEYYENMIAFELPLEKILRSMCLQSIIDKGVHRKVYSRVCEDIAFTYGAEQVITLTNLAKMGLFYQQGSIKDTYPFSDLKKELRLLSEAHINHQNPSETCFAYGGYTPIMIKLVEGAIRGGWRNMNKALKLLPGQFGMPENVQECQTHPRPAVVVYFVGGVTYGQIATIRLLSKLVRRQIVIATTEIINGETLIKSLIENYTLV